MNDLIKTTKEKIDRKISGQKDYIFNQEKLKEYEKEIDLLLNDENKRKIQEIQNDSQDTASIGKIIELIFRTKRAADTNLI